MLRVSAACPLQMSLLRALRRSQRDRASVCETVEQGFAGKPDAVVIAVPHRIIAAGDGGAQTSES